MGVTDLVMMYAYDNDEMMCVDNNTSFDAINNNEDDNDENNDTITMLCARDS